MAVDKWAETTDIDVFAQIGQSDIKPQNISFDLFVSPMKAEELFQRASIIIAHAGMGSILTALKYQKPIIVMPRKASLGEHRNEHQLATAEWVMNLNGVVVAYDEDDLKGIINSQLDSQLINISNFANDDLLEFLKSEINK